MLLASQMILLHPQSSLSLYQALSLAGLELGAENWMNMAQTSLSQN